MSVFVKTAVAAAVALGSLGAPDSAPEYVPALEEPAIQHEDVRESIAAGGMVAALTLFDPRAAERPQAPVFAPALSALADRHMRIGPAAGGLGALTGAPLAYGGSLIRATGGRDVVEIALRQSGDTPPVP